MRQVWLSLLFCTLPLSVSGAYAGGQSGKLSPPKKASGPRVVKSDPLRAWYRDSNGASNTDVGKLETVKRGKRTKMIAVYHGPGYRSESASGSRGEVLTFTPRVVPFASAQEARANGPVETVVLPANGFFRPQDGYRLEPEDSWSSLSGRTEFTFGEFEDIGRGVEAGSVYRLERQVGGRTFDVTMVKDGSQSLPSAYATIRIVVRDAQSVDDWKP